MESLPEDYSKIFRFQGGFAHLQLAMERLAKGQRAAMKEHIAGDGDEEFRGKELLEGRIMPGSFVRFVVGRVATRYASVLKQQNRPLIMSSLLPHEHRLSVRSIRARSARNLITSLKYYEYHHITSHSRITIRILLTGVVECYEILNSRFALEHRYFTLEHKRQRLMMSLSSRNVP